MGAPANGAAPGRTYIAPVPADPNLPTLWIIGDSTVRNGTLGDGVGNMDQWGWGAPIVWYFDLKKINVVNRAFGGTSSRTFYNAQWKKMVDLIKKGDFVIMQFGANDGGGIANGKGSIRGFADDTQDSNGETVHSFGGYIKLFIKETRDKGATPIVCSLTPHKAWAADGHLVRDKADSTAGWAEQAAKEVNAAFVPLNEIIARKYDELGKEAVNHIYVPWPTAAKPAGENLHTGWDGAIVNAECVISGLKALKDDPVADYFSDKGKTISAVDTSQPEAPLKTAAPASDPAKADATKPDATTPADTAKPADTAAAPAPTK
jgi:lysophospholipase L1-like esterase